MVAGGSKKTPVWEIDSAQAVATFVGQHYRIGGVAFSPDSTWLAVGTVQAEALVGDMMPR